MSLRFAAPTPAALRAAIDSALADAETARLVGNFKDATEMVYQAFGLARALSRLTSRFEVLQ